MVKTFQQSVIINLGAESDKANIDKAPATHQQKRKRKEKVAEKPLQQLHLTPTNCEQLQLASTEDCNGGSKPPLSCPTKSGVGHCAICGCKHPSWDHDHPC
jgi:hypothetical protein